MGKLKQNSFIFYFLFFILFTGLLPVEVLSEQFSIDTSLKLKAEDNDNVFFESIDKTHDAIFIVTPGLSFNYSTELFAVKLESLLDFKRYKNQTELDTVNQLYNLKGSYQFLKRCGLNVFYTYIDDTTFESELEETGRITFLDNRERYNAGMGLSWLFSERINVDLNYKKEKIEYSNISHVDYDRDTVSMFFNYKLKNELDTIIWMPSYYSKESAVNTLDNYSISVGWIRKFSETLSMKTFIGYRSTDIFYKDSNEKSDNSGVIIDCSITKNRETLSYSLGYIRDIVTNASGTDKNMDKVFFNIRKLLTERSGIQFNCSYYHTREELNSENTENTNIEDSHYFEIRPSWFYKITELHYIDITYAYSNDYNTDNINSKTSKRQRVWLSLNFQFSNVL